MSVAVFTHDEPQATSGAEQAIAYYHAAVARDPGFALAWARLSMFESRLWWFDIDASPKHKTAAEADTIDALRALLETPA